MTPDEDAFYNEYKRRGLTARTTTIEIIDDIAESCNMSYGSAARAVCGLVEKGLFTIDYDTPTNLHFDCDHTNCTLFNECPCIACAERIDCSECFKTARCHRADPVGFAITISPVREFPWKNR